MKKLIYTLAMALTMGLAAVAQDKGAIKVAIDLVNVTNDKVMVTVTPPDFKEKTLTYFIPKIIPGTYSEDNYGQFVEDFKAYDKKGNELAVVKGENSWAIADAKKLAKITYLVNDSFDTETSAGHDIFSPAGTNIEKDNFMLNTHGFVGYFNEKAETPYEVTVTHPAALWGATSMTDMDNSNEKDVFRTARYPELVDHPIMYSKPDYTTFTVDDMEILISVYSPTGKITAKQITPQMETMMRAQKRFLGAINSTKKYSVLIYLSTGGELDAQGYGALEHTTSTTVVMPEAMPLEQLAESLKDVVSHEFFHIVTPLSVHSKEIQYFNYNTPHMSEHLWMYEGVTEYFANLFQVNQGLIDEDDFYTRIAEKIANAKRFDETMPFTVMSKNILQQPYKDAYVNVYQKGALIAMCVDIIIREQSNGEKGILNLMRDLSKEYGNKKPFDDADLFNKVTELSYPEVGTFLNTYVSGNAPLPYDEFLAKMGVTQSMVTKPGNPFIKGMEEPYITINPATKQIMLREDIEPNAFFKALGVQKGEIITKVNGTAYSLDNINDLIIESLGWDKKEGEDITITVIRNGKEEQLKGKIALPVEDIQAYHATDASKEKLRQAWLKG